MITLDSIETEFGTITIFKKKATSSITYEQGGCSQSEADRNGITLASYVHAIFGLIIQAKARKILMIGCAGGTLATMLVQAGIKVTTIDANPFSFKLAKEYFCLPEKVECLVADGKSFLCSDTKYYDAIVIDAYHGDHVPAHLKSLAFYYLVADRLSPKGSVFVNIHVDHDLDRHAVHTAERLSNVFHDVRLLDAQGKISRNAIVMAGAVSHLNVPRLILAPSVDSHGIESELAAMEFCDWRPSYL